MGLDDDDNDEEDPGEETTKKVDWDASSNGVDEFQKADWFKKFDWLPMSEWMNEWMKKRGENFWRKTWKNLRKLLLLLWITWHSETCGNDDQFGWECYLWSALCTFPFPLLKRYYFIILLIHCLCLCYKIKSIE